MNHYSFASTAELNQKQGSNYNQMIFLGVALIATVGLVSLLAVQESPNFYFLKAHSPNVQVPGVAHLPGTRLQVPLPRSVPRQQIAHLSSLNSLVDESMPGPETVDGKQQMKWGPPMFAAILATPVIFLGALWKRTLKKSSTESPEMILPLTSIHSLSFAGAHTTTSSPDNTWAAIHPAQRHAALTLTAGSPRSLDRQNRTVLNSTAVSDVDDATMGIYQKAATTLQGELSELKMLILEAGRTSQQTASTLQTELGDLKMQLKEAERTSQQTATTVQTELGDLKMQLKEAERTSQQTASTVQTELGDLKMQLKEAERTSQQTTITLNEMQTELSDLKMQLKEAERTSQQTASTLQTELGDLKMQLKEAERTSQQTAATLQEMQTELSALKVQLQEAERTSHQSVQLLQTHEQAIDEIEQTLFATVVTQRSIFEESVRLDQHRQEAKRAILEAEMKLLETEQALSQQMAAQLQNSKAPPREDGRISRQMSAHLEKLLAQPREEE